MPGKVGILNEILENLLGVTKAVSERTRATGNEWGAVGSPRMSPEVSNALMRTSHSPYYIGGHSLQDLFQQMLLADRGANPDPYFFLHSHPLTNDPAPSAPDMRFLDVLPTDRDRTVMSVVSPLVGGEADAPNDLYEGPTMANLMYNHDTNAYQAADYVERWFEAQHHQPLHDDRVLEAVGNLTMDPGDKELAKDMLGIFQYSPPFLELNNRNALQYHVDVDNLSIPPLDVDPNTALEEIQKILKRYGHLDYAQGGLVDAA